MRKSVVHDPKAEAVGKVCANFMKHIQVTKPYWFVAKGGHSGCVGGVVRWFPTYPYPSEECSFCDKPVGDKGIMEASYEDTSTSPTSHVTFACHEKCAYKAAGVKYEQAD